MQRTPTSICNRPVRLHCRGSTGGMPSPQHRRRQRPRDCCSQHLRHLLRLKDEDSPPPDEGSKPRTRGAHTDTEEVVTAAAIKVEAAAEAKVEPEVVETAWAVTQAVVYDARRSSASLHLALRIWHHMQRCKSPALLCPAPGTPERSRSSVSDACEDGGLHKLGAATRSTEQPGRSTEHR